MTDHADGNGFPARTRGARKVMVLDIGLLGDTVHLLPALWNIRQAYPDAALHVAVAEHVTSVLKCVPWVAQIWGYPRFLKRTTFAQNRQFVARLRRERFDVLINLNGSDRSNWLTLFSGARARLVKASPGGGRHFWRHVFANYVGYHNLVEPAYLQRCRLLEKAGFPAHEPEFHVQLGPEQLAPARLTAADAGTYFHLSPFTTDDVKELPPGQLAELIGALEQRFPEKRWVISCSPTDRERRKMDALLALLPHPPWRVCVGNLDLVQVSAVIQNSAVHLCGDTGTLHLGLMVGARTVSWFRPNPGLKAWAPVGERHRTIVGKTEAATGQLYEVPTADLVRATAEVLASP
jgi:ADP-heptose:LPS heptosyltransferase